MNNQTQIPQNRPRRRRNRQNRVTYFEGSYQTRSRMRRSIQERAADLIQYTERIGLSINHIIYIFMLIDNAL